tara:strand:- start:7295 stop:7486 length:192 start_codon:yes stop_codon:yes gene_type:complete
MHLGLTSEALPTFLNLIKFLRTNNPHLSEVETRELLTAFRNALGAKEFVKDLTPADFHPEIKH